MNTLIFNYVDVKNAFADFFDQHRHNVDGVHSCRKYVKKHSTNLDMSKKALVKKISMLKSNYVEAGREQLGYKRVASITPPKKKTRQIKNPDPAI